MYKHTIYIIVGALLIFIYSCNNKDQSTPRPRGYFRIDLPEKQYKELQINCPYSFEYPEYSEIIQDPNQEGKPCWVNIHIPEFKGDIHISYKNIEGNIKQYTEDSRELAYKHTLKAEAIKEEMHVAPERDVYGVLYKIKGDVASPMQFFVTDSTKHFIRGSLYFRTEPNKDSLAPIIKFVEKDIKHLMESLHWKNK
ncbi:MAG: gliding motility lipoprotein GldD [Bacteroidota bacterium]